MYKLRIRFIAPSFWNDHWFSRWLRNHTFWFKGMAEFVGDVVMATDSFAHAYKVIKIHSTTQPHPDDHVVTRVGLWAE